jgi:hypothetical protein
VTQILTQQEKGIVKNPILLDMIGLWSKTDHHTFSDLCNSEEQMFSSLEVI